MGQLELLWNLQKHDHKLDYINSQIDKVGKSKFNETVSADIINLEDSIKKGKDNLIKSDAKVRKGYIKLKELNYQLSEIEKDLYGGNITDLKQLDFMDKESKRLREEINYCELEILSLMEEVERIKKDIEDIEIQHGEMIKEFKKHKLKTKNLEDRLIEEKNQEKEALKKITIKIKKEFLEVYYNIKNNKGSALAKINNNECSGCHMIISMYLMDKVKNEEELHLCEHCGRILYYDMTDEK